MPQLSQNALNTSQALSIKYNNLVYEMKAAGQPVTVLSLGEAFFDIPLLPMDNIPFPDLFHYSHSRGLPALRKEIAAHYGDLYNVPVDPDRELIITAGSKAAIFLAMLVTLNPGDEVLIQDPSWVSYPEQARLIGAVPVQVPYDVPVTELHRYVTSRTRMIIVNNPNNPSGYVYKAEELEYLTNLAFESDAYLLSDEAYSDFTAPGQFCSVGTIDPLKQNGIVVNSLSKNFGMSGWRLGYVIANESLTKEILKANQHIVTCPATILEYYMANYFRQILEITRPQIDTLLESRKIVGQWLQDYGLTAMPGSSTFYFFVSIAPSWMSSEEFCQTLLKEHGISVVPGSGYGPSCDEFIRVSVGTEPMEKIRKALMRIRYLIDETSERRIVASTKVAA